jgi:hypothetical protein
MTQRNLLFVSAVATLVAGAVSGLPPRVSGGADGSSTVRITPTDDKIRIEIGGELFTEYHFKNVPRPFFYPLLGPGGLPMMRHWPMKDVPDEEHDHIHHRSLWFTHGEINGQDFWSEGQRAGKVVHQKFLKLQSGTDEGVLVSSNKYVALDDKVVCTDERVFRVYARKGERLFDFEITLHASEGEATLGDTKEGSMAIRLAETMRLKGPKGKAGEGHIVNSEGVRDGDTWGKRAKWVDYYGPIQGQTVGVAIFDHPSNPRHPTWWHVRDYGLFAANPFGVHDFEKKPPGTGNFAIPAGQSATFRYRFYLHRGDEKQARVAERYAEYAAERK